MGTAFTSVFIREFNALGPGPSAWHSGMGRFPLYGLAHPQRRMASRATVGMDSGLLPLAIDSIQPDHALPAADLSIARDDGGMVHFRAGRFERSNSSPCDRRGCRRT